MFLPTSKFFFLNMAHCKRLAKVTSIRKCHAFVNNYFTKVLTMVKTLNSFEGLGLTKFNV